MLYGSRLPYARLLAEHLDAAGIRWNGNGVAPTLERRLARVHHESVRGGQERVAAFRRAGGAGGRGHPGHRTLGTDLPDRRCGRRRRLGDAAEGVRGGPGGGDADTADELRQAVTGLQARMRDGDALTTWPALAEWGRLTYAALVGDLEERRLPEDEQRAAAAVLRTLDALSGLDTVEPVADLALLDLTLDLELSGDLPRHGRIGDGVLVAPLSAAIGLDADEVFVLGLAEDLVPGRLGVDALLPDEIRALAGGQLPLARERIERRRRQRAGGLRGRAGGDGLVPAR